MIYTVTSGRSGSTLLQMALENHPEINTLKYEAFCDVIEGHSDLSLNLMTTYGFDNFPESGTINKTDDRWRNWDKLGFLKDLETRFNLIKILYHHLNEDIEKNIKKHKIIHLVREDFLACFVSMVVGKRRKLYHISADKANNYETEKIIIDVERLRKHYEHVQMHRDRFKHEFEVKYECLIKNWDEEMERIQEFIGVDKIKLPICLKQTIESNHRDLIENLSELEKSDMGFLV